MMNAGPHGLTTISSPADTMVAHWKEESRPILNSASIFREPAYSRKLLLYLISFRFFSLAGLPRRAGRLIVQ